MFDMSRILRCVAVALFFLGLADGAARATGLPIYGGPTYSANGGFRDTTFYNSYNVNLNAAGVAVGTGHYYDAAGRDLGMRSFTFGSAGLLVLTPLTVNSSNFANVVAIPVDGSGATFGYATKFGADSGERAVRWDASGQPVELGNLGLPPGNITSSAVQATNATGTAGGYSARYDAVGNYLGNYPVRWEAGSTQAIALDTLGSFSGTTRGDVGDVHAVNLAGVMVGYSLRSDAAGNQLGYRAVRWSPTGTAVAELQNLGVSPTNVTASDAFKINDSGTAVGYATKYVGGTLIGKFPARWDASGAVTQLEIPWSDPIGLAQGYAYGVNAGGAAAGGAVKHDANGNSLGVRPLRWDAGSSTPVQLATFGTNPAGFANSSAIAINASGITVGDSETFDASGNSLGSRAVYWAADGTMVDLTSLIDPSSGWTLKDASAIADTGWIAGNALFDPDGPGGVAAYHRTYALQIPEPSTCVELGSLTALVILRRKDRRSKAARRRPGRC
jgi:hypothetical protein